MSKEKVDRTKLDKAHEAWRSAEAKFADALKPILSSANPTKVKRDDALKLAELRAKADARMDEFFKRALS